MFKYGERREINTIFTTRNSIYKNSDKITAKVLPDDLLSVLKNNNLGNLDTDKIKANDFNSQNGNIANLIINNLTTNGEFLKITDPLFITNMEFEEAEEYLRNNLFATSFFNVVLNPEILPNGVNFYLNSMLINGDNLKLDVKEIEILDNIITINNNNVNNTNNIYGLNFKNIDSTVNNNLLMIPNLSNHINSGELILEIQDDIRFKSKNTEEQYLNHNVRFLKLNDNFSDSIITKINNNINSNLFIPVEMDRLILHDNEGRIINSNLNGNLTLSILEKIDINNTTIYRDTIKITNNNITKNILTNFNSSIVFNKFKNENIMNGDIQGLNDIEPKIYFEDALNFEKINETYSPEKKTSTSYIFRIENEKILTSKDFEFNTNDLNIIFNTKFNIKDNLDDIFTEFKTINVPYDKSLSVKVVDFIKDIKSNKIIFDNIHISNLPGTTDININNQMSIVGPSNFGIYYDNNKDTFIDMNSKLNYTISSNVMKYSNNIIGKYQLLNKIDGNSNNILNKKEFDSKYYPFPDYDTITNLTTFKENIMEIVNKMGLKYYLNNMSETDKKNNIIDSFMKIITNYSNNINIRDIYINSIKKFFFVEPTEKKFINGLLIEPDKIMEVLERSHLADDDITSDLTKNTNRIYWYYNNNLELKPYIEYHNMMTKPSDDKITFFNTQLSGGNIVLTDIFDTFTYNNGIEDVTEYIFENSCSFNGFIAMRENLSNNSKSSHFKVEGFFDRNNNVCNVEILYNCDSKWNIKISTNYDDNSLTIIPEHNSINSVLVSCSINLYIV